jgi:hypothetical protein
MAIVILAVVVLALGLAWKWSAQPRLYVFSPCRGLTATSSATTGVWNCPMEPAFSAGQNVTLTGIWATGYETLGCVPLSGQGSCVVPQIAMLVEYVHVSLGGGYWFVVQWKASPTVQISGGQNVTVTGTLRAINYPSDPGATYPIYHLSNQTNGTALLQPQPAFEIINAVLN